MMNHVSFLFGTWKFCATVPRMTSQVYFTNLYELHHLLRLCILQAWTSCCWPLLSPLLKRTQQLLVESVTTYSKYGSSGYSMLICCSASAVPAVANLFRFTCLGRFSFKTFSCLRLYQCQSSSMLVWHGRWESSWVPMRRWSSVQTNNQYLYQFLHSQPQWNPCSCGHMWRHVNFEHMFQVMVLLLYLYAVLGVSLFAKVEIGSLSKSSVLSFLFWAYDWDISRENENRDNKKQLEDVQVAYTGVGVYGFPVAN